MHTRVDIRPFDGEDLRRRYAVQVGFKSKGKRGIGYGAKEGGDISKDKKGNNERQSVDGR